MRIFNENGVKNVLLMVYIMEMFANNSYIQVTVYLHTTQLGPMPWCRQLVAGLLPQMPGFGSGQSMCNFW